MDGRRFTFVVGSLVVVLGAGAVLSRAGSLTPPDGPIQPTMVSLQDIKDSLDELRCAMQCRERAWEYANGIVEHTPLGTPIPLSLVEGSGELKQIILTGGGTLELRDGVGGPLIVRLTPVWPETICIPLHVRYSTGLYFDGPFNGYYGEVTVLYRPDPTVEPEPEPSP